MTEVSESMNEVQQGDYCSLKHYKPEVISTGMGVRSIQRHSSMVNFILRTL